MVVQKHCSSCTDQTGGRTTPHSVKNGNWKCGLCGHETPKRTRVTKKARDMEDLIKSLQSESFLKKIFSKKDTRPTVEHPKERFPNSNKANEWMSQKVAHYERHKPEELHHLFSPASGDYLPTSVHVGSSWKKEHEDHYNELKKQHPEAVKKAKEMTTGIAGRVSLSRVGPHADFHGMSIHEQGPTMAVGGGNIAGMGVDKPGRPGSGEPGVGPKAMKKYKDQNAAEAPKAGRKTFSMFMKGK